MNTVRFVGPLAGLSQEARQVLLARNFRAEGSLQQDVACIMAEVRAEGDVALRRFAARYDGVTQGDLTIPRDAWKRALDSLDPHVRAGLTHAARNLARVARRSLPSPLSMEVEPGVHVGRRADPLSSVGVYAPGGTAAYASSVLMGVVPARVAGVGEVIVCSPPGPGGMPSPVVLAAAELAGADRVCAVGGAGAIAAMAYGTASVPRVDRIVGPGNAWVAEAKRQVAGEVPIDAPSGPSELLVVADAEADPHVIVRELLAQAEHDRDACVVALVCDEALATRVLELLEVALPLQARRDTIETALRARGAVLTLPSLEEAWPFVEAFAAEHLLLALRDPSAALPQVRNAGTVFLGACSSVAFGDYVTGANHVLPTAGAARAWSGLSVLDFLRWQTWQSVDRAAAARLAPATACLATREGLPAHAAAARSWAREEEEPPTWSLRVREDLTRVEKHAPPRPPCAIDLTDNTNLFGVPPGVLEAHQALSPAVITRYPTPYSDPLRAALADEVGVQPEEVILGCGSDDLLDAAFRAVVPSGERLAYVPPTFGMVPILARAGGLTPIACPLSIHALAEAEAALVYLCSPNNPTGSLLPEGFVDTLLASTPAVVLLDEAYIDFASVPSRAASAPALQRLLVVRTLSKAFGLAGLRIGFAVGAPPLIEAVEKIRGPYKVGSVAERAALAALRGEGRTWVAARAQEVTGLRTRFLSALQACGFSPLPSEANFVLLPVQEPAHDLALRIRAHGVAVRPLSGLPGLGEALRITIGPWPLLERCLAALQETK